MIISVINKFIRLINLNLIIQLRPTRLFRSRKYSEYEKAQ